MTGSMCNSERGAWLTAGTKSRTYQVQYIVWNVEIPNTKRGLKTWFGVRLYNHTISFPSTSSSFVSLSLDDDVEKHLNRDKESPFLIKSLLCLHLIEKEDSSCRQRETLPTILTSDIFQQRSLLSILSLCNRFIAAPPTAFEHNYGQTNTTTRLSTLHL